MSVRPDPQPTHDPIAYREIEGHGGVPLLVATAGTVINPAILFIHGYGKSHRSFDRQFHSKLAERYFLVAFDLRGHGGSGKPWRTEDFASSEVWAGDVAAVVAATGVESPALVAWSYGAHVALDYLRHHGTVSALNLVGSLAALVATPTRNDSESTELQRIGSMARSLSPHDNFSASELTAERYRSMGLSDAEYAIARATELMMPAYVRRVLGTRDDDNRDLVGDLRMPILLSFGDQDRLVSSTSAHELVDTLPSARVSMYPATGHLPFVECHTRFNAELAGLLDESPAV